MKNFLNILIIALLTVLFFNLFSTGNTKKEGLDVYFSSSSYSVPATVIVKVSNYTDKSEKLNTCKDLVIRKSGEKIDFGKEFCENIEIKSNSVYDINLQKYYKNFKETGKYNLEVSLSGDRKFSSETNISNKGAISKLFTATIYAPIYNLFIWLVDIFSGSFGWAIIAVTIIIRIILIWPQHRSMVSQKKLQELQPKIKKIQEDNKGNQQAIGMKVLELYKKEKVNPLGSCGFLFIQLPIILVLYNVILSIKDYSNTFYLYSFLDNFDITKIDFNFYGFDLIQSGGTQGLILAIVVGLVQFLQIKLSLSLNNNTNKETVVLEKKVGDDKYTQMMPNPEIMNKFMLYVLPIMIGIATYTLFAGVGVYWGISTLFMLVQQVIVNKMLKKSS